MRTKPFAVNTIRGDFDQPRTREACRVVNGNGAPRLRPFAEKVQGGSPNESFDELLFYPGRRLRPTVIEIVVTAGVIAAYVLVYMLFAKRVCGSQE